MCFWVQSVFFVQGPKVMANDLELKIHKEIQMKLLKIHKTKEKIENIVSKGNSQKKCFEGERLS